MKKYIITSIFLLNIYTFAQTSPPENPKEIVTYALKALINGEIEKLVDITGNSELRKVNELLASIKGNDKKREELIEKYKTIKSWKIENSQDHTINGRNIHIVSTSWVVKTPVEKKPAKMVKGLKDPGKTEHTVSVDYMLEKIDGRWKIISRRSI